MTLEREDVAEEEEVVETSFSEVFSHALRGIPCYVVGLGDRAEELAVEHWSSEADEHDDAMLAHCEGPTVDLGCGPGRIGERLVQLGHSVLAVDVVPEAVRQTRERGVPTVLCDMFDVLPGEGEWQSVVLADGNIGIGGDPARLLARAADLLVPGGRIVVELLSPGTGAPTVEAVLECDGVRSRPFPWARVDAAQIGGYADEAGLVVRIAAHAHGSRWCCVLEKHE